jgi:serine/threonine-protein kinase
MVAREGRVVAGRYELLDKVGEGGMAIVWHARMHGALGFSRPVAIKEIKRQYQTNRNYIDMFIEEARVGSELAHPNIVQIFDFIVDGDSHFLVMEWVDGCDLDAFVHSYTDRGERTPWQMVVAVGIGTLRGLSAAHDRRHIDGSAAPVIHRDISPHNILLGSNGIVKLTDFGLARARDRLYSLTAPGTVKGKLSYLAPEITLGKGAGVSSDLFSMGSCLWEALTGKRLFDGRSDLEVFKQIRACDIKPVSSERSDLPLALVKVIDCALQKEPENRYSSARDMAGALANVLKQAPVSTDAVRTLGDCVMQARRRGGTAGEREHTPEPLDMSTWTFDIDVESRVQEVDLPGVGPAAGDPDTVEIEFSEVGFEPPKE